MPYSPIQPDGDGRHDERVPEEQRRRFGRQVAAEILKEQVLLGLLLGAAFGSHGRAEEGLGSEHRPGHRARATAGPRLQGALHAAVAGDQRKSQVAH